MELSREQFDRIKECLPRQRGNVRVGNLTLLNALLYTLEHGCKWRGLPPSFGPWHTIYTRLNRWSKKQVIERVFTRDDKLDVVFLAFVHLALIFDALR